MSSREISPRNADTFDPIGYFEDDIDRTTVIPTVGEIVRNPAYEVVATANDTQTIPVATMGRELPPKKRLFRKNVVLPAIAVIGVAGAVGGGTVLSDYLNSTNNQPKPDSRVFGPEKLADDETAAPTTPVDIPTIYPSYETAPQAPTTDTEQPVTKPNVPVVTVTVTGTPTAPETVPPIPEVESVFAEVVRYADHEIVDMRDMGREAGVNKWTSPDELQSQGVKAVVLGVETDLQDGRLQLPSGDFFAQIEQYEGFVTAVSLELANLDSAQTLAAMSTEEREMQIATVLMQLKEAGADALVVGDVPEGFDADVETADPALQDLKSSLRAAKSAGMQVVAIDGFSVRLPLPAPLSTPDMPVEPQLPTMPWQTGPTEDSQ